MNHINRNTTKVYLLILSILFVFVFPLDVKAGEGMWLPQLLKSLNEKEMKKMGMKISAEDIYSINKGSLKDAIAQFDNKCTSELISSKGLLLTNHHCGFDQIQNHSSIENNLIKHGFWAKTYADELPNPGLTATFIDYIDDVTEKALAGVYPDMSASERQSMVDKNIEKLTASYSLQKFQKVFVRAFFDGNKYYAFVNTTFNDVRLVGTPPESIGKFGADTDNWVWPRHTGDFAFFRIYADKNNKPAEYSKDNIPYTPKHYLSISLDGVKEGDFTMVFGFPRRTYQYLPKIAVEQILKSTNPAKINIRETALQIMDKYMRADEKTKIQYASKYNSISNHHKKWIGENLGLNKSKALDKKAKYEAEFSKRINNTGPYQKVLKELNILYDSIAPYALAREYYSEIVQRNVELSTYMFRLNRLVSAYENGGEAGLQKILPTIKNGVNDFYKDLNVQIDAEKLGALLTLYVDKLPARFVPDLLRRENLGMKPNESYASMANDLYKQSSLTSAQELNTLFSNEPKVIVQQIKSDPFFGTIIEWAKYASTAYLTPYNQWKTEIDIKQALYTKAQLETFPDKRFYPDANSTMRVTYGNVMGYSPRDGMKNLPRTYIDGVIEKYVPGDYEFDLPERYIQLYEEKNFGPYTDKKGRLPVCFTASNHTTGGNSGSPAINAKGHLIGINFDRVWEGTMSDYNYDTSICRNIMVDARYILWVVDIYAGAGHLVDEMTLIHSKKSKKRNKKKRKLKVSQ
ncbi:MAG: S46 family peptidase [Saprospiraceae bacterium]